MSKTVAKVTFKTKRSLLSVYAWLVLTSGVLLSTPQSLHAEPLQKDISEDQVVTTVTAPASRPFAPNMQPTYLRTKSKHSKTVSANANQQIALNRPTQKEIKVIAEQTAHEKKLIKQFQEKKTLNKGIAAEKLALNKTSEGNQLSLTPEEKAIVLPTSSKIPNKKSKTMDEILINKLEFNQANMLDVARALADISGMNFVATEDAAKKM